MASTRHRAQPPTGAPAASSASAMRAAGAAAMRTGSADEEQLDHRPVAIVSSRSIEEAIVDLGGLEPIHWPDTDALGMRSARTASADLRDKHTHHPCFAAASDRTPTSAHPARRRRRRRPHGIEAQEGGEVATKKSKASDRAAGGVEDAHDGDHMAINAQRALQWDPHIESTASSQPEVLPLIHLLPAELMLSIFRHLDCADKLTCSKVCRRWYHILLAPACWESVYMEDVTLGYEARNLLLTRNPRHLFFINSRMNRLPGTFIRKFNLENLDLTSSSIEPRDFIHMVKLSPFLRRVDISNTSLDDTCIQALATHCQRLQSFGARMCANITGAGLRVLTSAHGSTLKTLSIGWLSFSKEDFHHMCPQLPQLQHLDVSGCQESVDDDSIVVLCHNCPKLVVLDASDCYDISDRGVQAIINNLDALKRISLSRCHHITVVAMQTLARDKGLRQLDLFGCYQSVYPHIMSVARGVAVNESILAPVECVPRPQRPHGARRKLF